MVYKLKKIGVMKLALFMGLYGVFVGLITGIIFSLFSSMVSSVATAEASLGVDLLSFGWLNIIFMPLFYGIFSFLMGIVFGLIANVLLKIIKGMDFHFLKVEDPLPKAPKIQKLVKFKPLREIKAQDKKLVKTQPKNPVSKANKPIQNQKIVPKIPKLPDKRN